MGFPAAAQRMEDANFCFRWEQTGTILFKHMVMKLSLKDKGDLQGQRQGVQSKISVQKKKKKVNGMGAESGESGRWGHSQTGDQTYSKVSLHFLEQT